MSPTTTKDPDMCPDSTPSLVCLPPISDDLQMIWTQAELTSELDEHPQLIHTFSYFPYPSMPEIALLCLRYGLQMEKVKTWFMVQRIRCGISWSSEEIEETRSRLLYNQDQLHFKSLVDLAKKSSIFQTQEELTASAPKNEVKLETSTSHTCPPLIRVSPEAKRLKTEFIASAHDSAKASHSVSDAQMADGPWQPLEAYGKKSPDTAFKTESKHLFQDFTIITGSGQMFGVDGTGVSRAVACLPSEEELYRKGGTVSLNSDEHINLQHLGFQEQSGGVLREDLYMPVTRRQRKTKEQLAILKSFFLECQWARREDYKKLEEITGLPRPEIIQWFGDTRYALKHGQLKWFRDNAQGRPSWLDEPQHLISQNGRQSEAKQGSNPSGIVTSKIGVTGEYISTNHPMENSGTVSVINKGISSIVNTNVQMPPDNNAVRSNQTSKICIIDSTDNMDGKWVRTSGTGSSKLSRSLVQENLGLNVPCNNNSELNYHKKHSPLPCSSQQSIYRVNYDVLEQYWAVQRHIKEVDLQSVARESGLSKQEVLDWFCQKSNDTAGVVVCLVDEEEDDSAVEGDDDDDDDDVIIQD